MSVMNPESTEPKDSNAVASHGAMPDSAAIAAQGTAYPNRWKALSVLVVSILVVVLDNTVLNVALKTIQDDLGATQDQLIWAINGYSLVFAALLFTWGVLGDRYGRKRILMIGLVLFAAASALSAFAHSPEQLIAFRALMGIGGASVLPVSLAIITVIFPPQERGKAIGVWAAAVGGAVALGPLLGGLLLEHPQWFNWLIGNDWGSVFLINVPIIIVGLVGIWFLVPESKNLNPGRLDPVGLVLSIVGMLALVYGIQEAGWDKASTYVYIAIGLAVLVGFLYYEARTDHPSLDLSLFKIRSFTVPLTGTALSFAALSGALVFLAFYYQDVRAWSPLQSGALTLSFAVGQLINAPRSSKMVKRFGARRVIMTGLSLAIFGMLMISQMTTSSPVWYLLLFGFIFGSGLGNVIAPATTRMTLATPPARSGAGSAVQNTVRQVAAVLSVAALSSIFRTVYSNGIPSSTVEGLLGPVPAEQKAKAVSAATESIGGAYAVAGQLEANGLSGPANTLRQLANDAFMPSLHTAAWIALALLVVALVIFYFFLPAQAEAASWSVGGSAPAPSAVPGGRIEADGQPDALHQAHLVDETDEEQLSHVDQAPLELDVKGQKKV